MTDAPANFEMDHTRNSRRANRGHSTANRRHSTGAISAELRSYFGTRLLSYYRNLVCAVTLPLRRAESGSALRSGARGTGARAVTPRSKPPAATTPFGRAVPRGGIGQEPSPREGDPAFGLSPESLSYSPAPPRQRRGRRRCDNRCGAAAALRGGNRSGASAVQR